MIISFSGRKGCGKTYLSNILVNDFGFKKIGFADYLKQILSKLYSIDISWFYDQDTKEKEFDLIWNSDFARNLELIIGINSFSLDSTYKRFSSIREAMQYIGTEVLRKYDCDFHVKQLEELIDLQYNYVLDDVRFPNELNLLKKIGAKCIYIVRPYYFNISNHLSEVSLKRFDFEFVLLNNKSLHQFKRKFIMFLDTLIKPTKNTGGLTREYLKKLLNNCSTKEVANKINCSRDKVVWWASKFMIDIDRNVYKHDCNVFKLCNSESAYWAGILSADGSIKKHLKYDYLLELTSTDKVLVNGFKKFIKSNKPINEIIKDIGKKQYSIAITSPYMVDDLKFWNLKPKKSRINEVPDCIINDDELLRYWLVGLIDGDGCICRVGTSIVIKFLASEQIVDFVMNKFNIKCCKYQEKDIDNLYSLVYNGKYAVELYKTIFRGKGLKRKWAKMEGFVDKVWQH